METKEVNDFRNTKPHQDKNWLEQAYVTDGKTVAEISDELNISKKLVETLIRVFEL